MILEYITKERRVEQKRKLTQMTNFRPPSHGRAQLDKKERVTC